MRVTLSEFKNALYSDTKPLLYTWKGGNIAEDAFLNRFFPESFYLDDHEVRNGRTRSLRTLLTKRNGSASQRNKIFNRKYNGYTFSESLCEILMSHSEFWDEICLLCKREVDKAEDVSGLCQYIHNLSHEDEGDEASRQYLAEAVDKDASVGLAATVVYLMLDGDLSKLLNFLRSERVNTMQFSYLERTIPQLKHAFGNIRGLDNFSDILSRSYSAYNELFSYVVTIKNSKQASKYNMPLDQLYASITSTDDRKSIYISGPGGAEKNAITQLLFIKLAEDVRMGNNITAAPYYINLGYYSRVEDDGAASSEEELKSDFTQFSEYCLGHHARIPVVFIDGEKNYALEQSNLDYILNQLIDELPQTARLIVTAENAVTTNPVRQRRPAAFATGKFACEVVVESLHLQDADAAEKYLRCFKSIYAPKEDRQIYSKLRALGISQIDTYQLRMLLPHLWDASDLAELYEILCMDYLGGKRADYDEAIQWAFNFAYTDKPMPSISRRLKDLLSSHESIQEFFIACWYLEQIREETYQNNIRLLNLVMPKGVTRFIVPMLNRNVTDEAHVLDLIEHNYSNMALMAKSEMTYWLGRMKAPSIAERAEHMLEHFYKLQKDELIDAKETDTDYKQKLFLLRGISVSLIVKGHMDISDEYILSLINNSLANEINRGFHLEYYGDKAYLPVYNNLDFMDDITRGQRTLNQLITANEVSMQSMDLPPVFELNLFTICSILQARVEVYNPNITFDLTPYLERACQHIEWYLQNGHHITKVLREYLSMVKRDFEKREKQDPSEWGTMGAETYAAYCKRVYRTGWVKRRIETPETVAEHMYHAWMMAMMFLPDCYPGYDDYSKDKILKLLLIHDVAEAVTGDIEKPKKAEDPARYRDQESQEMGIWLLRGSYPSIAAVPESYEVWQLWDNKDDINGRIAHEIDILQTLFQLLTYINEYPECFEESDVTRWLRERNDIRTMPGRNILKNLILANATFRDILQKYHVIP